MQADIIGKNFHQALVASKENGDSYLILWLILVLKAMFAVADEKANKNEEKREHKYLWTSHPDNQGSTSQCKRLTSDKKYF